jgi:ribosome recycling factor
MFEFSELDAHVESTINWLSAEYKTISTGRANPAMLDSILVDSYGAKQPLKAVASITIEDPKTLRITPWGQDMIRPIETALNDSGLPMSVAVDEKGVRVHTPELTEETRKKIAKLLGAKHEDSRVTLRKRRNEIEKEIEGGEFGDDDKKRFKDQLQKKIDEGNKKLAELTKKKEEEVMTI